MRRLILTLMLCASCAGCSTVASWFGMGNNNNNGLRPGLQNPPDGLWPDREKSVPGVPSHYGVTQPPDDN